MTKQAWKRMKTIPAKATKLVSPVPYAGPECQLFGQSLEWKQISQLRKHRPCQETCHGHSDRKDIDQISAVLEKTGIYVRQIVYKDLWSRYWKSITGELINMLSLLY